MYSYNLIWKGLYKCHPDITSEWTMDYVEANGSTFEMMDPACLKIGPAYVICVVVEDTEPQYK